MDFPVIQIPKLNGKSNAKSKDKKNVCLKTSDLFESSTPYHTDSLLISVTYFLSHRLTPYLIDLLLITPTHLISIVTRMTLRAELANKSPIGERPELIVVNPVLMTLLNTLICLNKIALANDIF